MRNFVIGFLLLYSSASSAAGMAVVPEENRYCYQNARYCYEWQMLSDPAVHFIAWGDEDGIDYSFYRKSKNGEYQHIVRVYPVLRDSSRDNSLYWAYPWDMEDIAPSSGPGQVLATFKHTLLDDGEIRSPDWQKHIPAVLFLGHTTQPNITAPKLRFRSVPLLQLRAKAGG
jgi:hypothetical protein